MARSKYRTRKGVCVDGACRHVSLEPVQDCTCYAAGQRMAPILKAAGARIGIRFVTHTREYDRIFEPAENVPITPNGELFVDFPDADVVPAAAPRRPADPAEGELEPVARRDHARGGAAARRARQRAACPGIDRDLARCGALAGSRPPPLPRGARPQAQHQIVPWIPYLRRNRITILGSQVAQLALRPVDR